MSHWVMRCVKARLWGALLCALLGCSAQAQVRLADQRGSVLVLPQTPQRIISLVPSLTESVCALGGCAKLVGTDRYSNAPPEVVALPKLGGLDDAHIERIVQLHPDVVLAAPSIRAANRLEQLGLKVLVIDTQTHEDVRGSLTTLAQMLGTPDQAERLWQRLEREIQAARDRIGPALQGQRVYFEIDTALYAAGPSSFIGQTLAQLGLHNIVPAPLSPFPKLSPEFVLRAQPDIVMGVDTSVRAMAQRPGWSQLRALQRQRTCSFSSARYELLIRPGPRLGEAAQLLADCLVGLP
jgi:iron complex transport system substrate-binding protein